MRRMLRLPLGAAFHWRSPTVTWSLESDVRPAQRGLRLGAHLRIRRWHSVPATTKPLAEFFAFLWRHLFPPFSHAFPHALRHPFSHAMTHMPFSTSRAAPAAEQNPAERQQPERLPEGECAPAEQRRQ